MTKPETTNEIRQRVQKQIAAAQGLRIEAMARQGRTLIVEATPATRTGRTSFADASSTRSK